MLVESNLADFEEIILRSLLLLREVFILAHVPEGFFKMSSSQLYSFTFTLQ